MRIYEILYLIIPVSINPFSVLYITMKYYPKILQPVSLKQ